MDLEVISRFIGSVGLPAGLLIGLLYGFYRIAKPLGERFIQLHADFLTAIVNDHSETRGEVKTIHGKVDKITKKLDID